MDNLLTLGVGATVMALTIVALISSVIVVLHKPVHGSLGRILQSHWWAMFAWFLVLPWTCGEFARGELSANPWEMAVTEYHRAGVGMAALELIQVTLADTWLFLGFAEYALQGRLSAIKELWRQGIEVSRVTELEMTALHRHRYAVGWNLLLGVAATARSGPIYVVLSLLRP